MTLYRYTGSQPIEAPRDLSFGRTPGEPTGQGRDILPGEVIETDKVKMPYWEEVKPAPKPRRKTASGKTTKKKKATISRTKNQQPVDADAPSEEG